MWTITFSLLLLALVVSVVLKLKSYFSQSYQDRLIVEIEDDMAEEFPNLKNLDTEQEEDFLDWVEGLQQEEGHAKKEDLV
jgi:hypothetical protein